LFIDYISGVTGEKSRGAMYNECNIFIIIKTPPPLPTVKIYTFSFQKIVREASAPSCPPQKNYATGLHNTLI
jgi:hypothetical protein